MTREEFTKKYYTTAKSAAGNSGVFPETILAAAIVESNTGKSMLSSKYNNFFGIKAGSNWKGRSVNVKTKEYYNNTPTTITDTFRVYSSPAASFKDYVNFLSKNQRYNKALKAKNFQEQILLIASAGYATAPNYAEVLTQIAEAVKKYIPTINALIKSDNIKLIGLAGLVTIFLINSNSNDNKKIHYQHYNH